VALGRKKLLALIPAFSPQEKVQKKSVVRPREGQAPVDAPQDLGMTGIRSGIGRILLAAIERNGRKKRTLGDGFNMELKSQTAGRCGREK
jgi:hypothetical protein